MMTFVDASALVAIILREPDCEPLLDRIEAGGAFITSPIAVYEATLALRRVTGGDIAAAANDLRDVLDSGAIKLVAIDPELGFAALDAFRRFGKGRHSARLNMGDCFAYAVSKSHDAAILFVGDDFVHTDLKNAIDAN